MFNVLCAIIPCSATQPPPEAYIGDHYNVTTPSIRPLIDYRSREDSLSNTVEKRIDPLFIDNNLVGSEYNLRSKRLGEDESVSSWSAFPSASSTQRPTSVETRRPEFLQEPLRNFESRRSAPVRQRNLFSNNGLFNNGLFSRNPLFTAIPAIPVLLGTFMRSMTSNDNSGSGRLVNNLIGRRPSRASSVDNQLDSNIGTRTTFDLPTVQTNSGKIRGHYMGTMKGRRISAFEGIPYAESPLGRNRFRVIFNLNFL